jgi:hypothetical protein
MLSVSRGTRQLTVFRWIPVVSIALGASLGCMDLASPSAAGAFARSAPPPVYSTAPGLPDGRVYEQVSPVDKDGNQAGASTNLTLAYGGLSHYALASPDGNSVIFEGSGPMGETTAGYNLYFEAQRSSAGWTTKAIFPRAQRPVEGGTLETQPQYVDPSSDLSHVVFEAGAGVFTLPPYPACGYGHQGESQLYLDAAEPTLAATWLTRPETVNPIENCSEEGESGGPAGGTPNFSTVYFTFPDTLLPEDASRAAHTEGTGQFKDEYVEAWGFYEYRNGELREAAVLPDGSLDPFGAVPAASGHGRAVTGNQVSTQNEVSTEPSSEHAQAGSRAFFVSPDPASCEPAGHNNCALDPPELYVRENGERTALVSRDTLLPEVGGLPASAPDGALGFPGASVQYRTGGPNQSYVYASPDGSHAFFESDDQLTSDAPEGPPGNTTAKTYDFDANTGELEYLPDVTAGGILASSSDGSRVLFDSAGGVSLWSAGTGGGTVTPISSYSADNPARASTDGSVFVFTAAGIPGFNDVGFKQIFRYDVAENSLACASCPPAGVMPTGNAVMSPLQAGEAKEGSAYYSISRRAGLADERGISSDGDRIFFDTLDPLVPQDTNTGSSTVYPLSGEVIPEGRDVYEWENGTVYLLSSGKSQHSSYFLDNSENGDDVFFATTEGLVSGDTDGAYDVYDARVPHPGDNPPPAAAPCQGSVCQGSPQMPSPLTPPASATFSGPGNPSPELPYVTKTTAKKGVRCTKGRKLSHGKCVRAKKKPKGSNRSAKRPR